MNSYYLRAVSAVGDIYGIDPYFISSGLPCSIEELVSAGISVVLDISAPEVRGRTMLDERVAVADV